MSAAKRDKSKSGHEALEAALTSDDPMGELMTAIDVDKEPGRMFNMAHAFMLEVNSATMSILFDRFDDDELDEMEAALTTIGATRTLADWRLVRGAFNELVADGMDRYDASDDVAGNPSLKPILRRSDDQADEVEAKLVDFARANWERLAGVV